MMQEANDANKKTSKIYYFDVSFHRETRGDFPMEQNVKIMNFRSISIYIIFLLDPFKNQFVNVISYMICMHTTLKKHLILLSKLVN